MTTFAVASKALLLEVEGRLQTLVPNVESSVRFLPIDEAVLKLKGNKKITPKLRSFEIGPATWVGRTQVGAGLTMATYTHEIHIYYPGAGRRYNNMALSDADQIDRLLLNTPAGVAGIQLRMLEQEAAIAFEMDEDDNFATLILTLQAMYETTAT